MCYIFCKLQTSNRQSDLSKQRKHVMDQVSMFELNPTVKELGKSILLQLRKSEINVVAQRPSHSPSDH